MACWVMDVLVGGNDVVNVLDGKYTIVCSDVFFRDQGQGKTVFF